MTISMVNPPGWPRPKGYSNGVISSGRVLHVAGQVGWTKDGVFEAKDFVGQLDQALANVVEVLHAAGAGPAQIVNMTIYVTDLDAYRGAQARIGEVWRARLGKVFPAMALVGVAGLVEPEALVEVQVVAALHD
jgi:enamine deaminase RidA (YjgF/YER057c/UK114 family)